MEWFETMCAEICSHSIYEDVKHHYKEEKYAMALYMRHRFPNGIVCPHCGGEAEIKGSGNRDRILCKTAYTRYSIFANSPFRKRTNLSLSRFIYSIFLFRKYRLSAKDVQRLLEINWKAAYRLKKVIVDGEWGSENVSCEDNWAAYLLSRQAGLSQGEIVKKHPDLVGLKVATLKLKRFSNE